MINITERNLTNAETDKSLFIRKNKSLYVEKSARNKSIKYRFLTYIKRVATVEFQKDIIYKSLSTKNEFVKKFIDAALIRRLRLQEISDYHYKIIDDRSIFYEGENFQQSSIELQSKLTQFLIVLLTRMQFVPLIYPEQKFKMIWDITACLGKLYFLYLIPIQLAWTQQRLLFDTYIETTIIMLIILLIDFVLSLNTVYYESGQLVINRVKIVKHALTRAYGLEWISTIMILFFLLIEIKVTTDINVNTHSFYLILLLFLVHMKGVRDKAAQYEMALNLQKITAIYLELIKFVLLIFYAIHIFSCIWFWASEFSYLYYHTSWLTSDQDTWQHQYLLSFYYACVTMYTVGYGDITPKSNLEKAIAIMLIMISSIQLSYSINTVGNIIQKITWYSEEKKNNLSIINQYMSRKKIPLPLQMQIREYLTKYWESKNMETSLEENNIIKQLSDDLQQKLMIQSNQAIIQQTPFLSNNFTLQCQSMLLKKVNVIHLEPDKQINLQDQFLGFVEEGEIETFIQNGPASYRKKVKKGEFFNLKVFILGQHSNEQYKSQNFSKILVLNRIDFISTLKEFPNDYERFCEIKDRMIFNQDYQYLTEQCSSCNSVAHSIDKCPLLHHVPQREFLIKRHQFPIYQNRKPFQRRKRKLIRQIDQDELKDIVSQYDSELKLYNVPQLQKSDVDEFNMQQRFKIQQSVFPIQREKERVPTIVITEQLAGIQRQFSIPYTSQNKIIMRKNTINPTYFKSDNESLAASMEEQLHNRLLYLKSYKEDFKDHVISMEILEKKCKNQSQSTKHDHMLHFDCVHNFIEYYPHNNIENLCKKIIYKSHKIDKLKIYIDKFIKYLQYPAAYFEQYTYYQTKIIRIDSFEDRILGDD